MKTIYLIHCWDGTSQDGWYPWLSKVLISKDIEIKLLDMPDTNNPSIEKWVNHLEQSVENLDANTYFIGHSIGCQTILRYLEKKELTQIGGMLLVTPWLDLLPYAISDSASLKIANPWIHTPIDFEKVKQFTNNIYAIFSNNDYFVDMNQSKEFESKLSSKNKVVHEKGHMSQEDGIYESFEILETAADMLEIELLDEVDENNHFTGRFYPRDYIHANLLYHRIANIWIQNQNGNLLMQKRSHHKKTDPDKWSITGGHVVHNEEVVISLIREVKEEIGISITEPPSLMFIDKNLGTEEKKKANFDYYFYIKMDIDLKKCNLQKEEVEEVAYISLEDFKNNCYPNGDKGLFDKYECKDKIIHYLESQE